jgi:DNA (cytosine-5)-methyltransferase 3A
MIVLSLFDGISGARVALARLGIKVYKYYASEIDKYAMQISKKNYPDTIQIGDVTKVNGYDYKDVDLLVFGSPCQSFSVAGKGEGFDGKSGLFYEALRILREVKPKYFLMENVKMKKEWRDQISKELGVEPVLINSNLVSAQNRPRLYWVGERQEDGTYKQVPIAQPEDKGTLLKDIIEENVDTGYVLSEKLLSGFDAKMARRRESKSGLDNFNVRDLDGKSSTLTARYFKMSMSDPYVKHSAIKDKSNTLVATLYKENAKSMITRDKLGLLIEVEVPAASTERRTEEAKEHTIIDRDFLYRKLTPLECERLQTFPDLYTEGVSNTQRYKALGNSFTVEVITHIFKIINTLDTK